MRITFLNGLYPPHGSAGAENSLRMLAGSLSARGHDCAVITLTPGSEATEGTVDGIHVTYLPLANVYWPYGARRPAPLRPVFQLLDAFNPVMLRRVARVLAAQRPDVVNCHNLQGFSVAAWVAAARLGIPVVQTVHDYYLGCPRSAMWRPGRGNCARPCVECRAFALPRRRLSRIPAAITAVSHRMFDRLAAAGVFPDATAQRQPVRIIRGNNAAMTVPPDAARPAGALRLGFMGRLEPTKGLETLIDALDGLPTGQVSLSVAGTGAADYVDGLRAHATGRGRITFLGHVRPADFFPTIDLLVIPSVWEDPFPRVFHEALAYGVPSLVSPLGGLREVIVPGRTGFVAAGADAAALRAALTGLAGHGWDRAALARECRAAAAAYAPDRIAGQYEAVLHAAAHGQPIPTDAGETWRPPAALSPSPQFVADDIVHGT